MATATLSCPYPPPEANVAHAVAGYAPRTKSEGVASARGALCVPPRRHGEAAGRGPREDAPCPRDRRRRGNAVLPSDHAGRARAAVPPAVLGNRPVGEPRLGRH